MIAFEEIQPGAKVRWVHTAHGQATLVEGKVLRIIEKDALTPRPPCGCRDCQKFKRGGYVTEDSVLVEVEQFGENGQRCRSHYYLPRLSQIEVTS